MEKQKIIDSLHEAINELAPFSAFGTISDRADKVRTKLYDLARELRHEDKRVVPANDDKPHRCPECHTIPLDAQMDGRGLPGKKYACDVCNVQWKVSEDAK